MKPGFYDGISNEDYHHGEGVSSSGVKKLLNTPAHYWAAYLDPEREPTDTTPAMAFGTACHTAILEPDEYATRHLIIPKGLDRRRKADKEVIEAVEADAEAAGATTIKAEDDESVQKIAGSMARSKQWQRLHAEGVCERSYYWIDEETGVLCKCRPDWQTWAGPVNTETDLIVDVKSSFDASPDGFERASYNLSYHVSAAFYLDGVAAVTGVKPGGFVFAAVEKESPFATAFYNADEGMLREGRKAYRKALALYANSVKTGAWPAYPDKIVNLGLPRYAKTSD